MNHSAEFPSSVGPRPAQPSIEPFKLLFSLRENARALAVSKRTVENLIAAGLLKTRRIGRRVLIHRKDLEEFARRDHPSVGGE